MKCLMMEIVDNVAVDDGSVEEDSGVVGAAEEGDGVIEAAERRVGALKLEV